MPLIKQKNKNGLLFGRSGTHSGGQKVAAPRTTNYMPCVIMYKVCFRDNADREEHALLGRGTVDAANASSWKPLISFSAFSVQ